MEMVFQQTLQISNDNTASNLFTFIEISQIQGRSPSSAFIKLITLRYKRQNRASNGDSEII